MRNRNFPRVIALIGAVAALWTTASLLAREHKVRKHTRAEAAASAAKADLEAGRGEAALRALRRAVALEPGMVAYRLALSQTLASAGRVDEASAYLQDLLRQDPISGPANLVLARVNRHANRLTDAEAAYYRAIYGRWLPAEHDARMEARLELVDLLTRTADRNRVRAELTQLAVAFPGDLTLQLRTGRSLLSLDFADDAARIFRETIDRFAQPGAAHAGLAAAEFARQNYAGALSEANRALAIDRADADAARIRQLAVDILALDPTLPRLSARERNRRWREFVGRARAELARCDLSSDDSDRGGLQLRALADSLLRGTDTRGADSEVIAGVAGALAVRLNTVCAADPGDEILGLVARKLAS